MRSRIFPALAFALLTSLSPVRAQVDVHEPDPSVWLRKIYDLYKAYEKSEEMEKHASTKLVEARAAKSLAALFRKESDCLRRTQEICAIDWDWVVDGQDVQLSKISVGPAVIEGEKARVVATFVNLGSACENTYFFVREDGEWKVEDIETKSGKDAPLRIRKILSDFDYSQ